MKKPYSIAKKLSLLNQATLHSLDLHASFQVIRHFTEIGLRILQADYAVSWCRTAGGQKYELAFSSPQLPFIPRPPRPKGVRNKVENTHTPFFYPVIKKSAGFNTDVTGFVKSCVVIPVSYKGHIYGNMAFYFKTKRVFSEEEKSLCTALGQSAAQAITISRLYGDLQEFKYTLDRTLDAIFIFDPQNFYIQYINRGAARLSGLPAKQLLGKKFTEILPDFSESRFGRLVRPLMGQGQQSLVFESTLQTKTGICMPIEVFIQYIPDAGSGGQFLGIAHDITERKQAQETLEIAYHNLEDRVLQRTFQLQEAKHKAEAEKARIDAVLASMGEGIFVTDQTGATKMMNRAAEELLGFLADECVGKHIAEVVRMEDKSERSMPLEERPICQALQTGKKVTGQYFYYRKDGSKLAVGITVTPVIIAGQISGVVELFRDITQERQIDKAKTEFVSLASHQLRTPMSAINWYTESVLREEIGKLNPKQKKYLREVRFSNHRMIALVNALLNASRIELGTFIVEEESLDIAAMAKSLVEELRPTIQEKRLVIKQDYAGMRQNVLADPKLTRIVLQNLISNAVKYTPTRGKVDICITQEKRQGRAGVLITVSDTGYGIPKHQSSKIFNKLFRADNVKTRDTDGTGLGLYLVKSVVEYIGGNIWFTSIEGKGTKFCVFLPLVSVRLGQAVEA